MPSPACLIPSKVRPKSPTRKEKPLHLFRFTTESFSIHMDRVLVYLELPLMRNSGKNRRQRQSTYAVQIRYEACSIFP